GATAELAASAAAGQGRLVALGSVPLGWPGAAAQARRCLDELGMAGIAIGSRGAGRDLDDPVNDELWELLAERRVFVFLHPSGVPDAQRQRDFYLAQLVGYPMETALAVARLVFGRVLERFDLTLCLAHGGGCLPAIRGRMDMGWRNKDVAHTTARPPSFYTGRLYYDTAVFDPIPLRGPRPGGPRPPFRAPRRRAAGQHRGRGPGGRRKPGHLVGQRGQAARAGLITGRKEASRTGRPGCHTASSVRRQREAHDGNQHRVLLITRPHDGRGPRFGRRAAARPVLRGAGGHSR